MQIACLGWGSLVWNPGTLPIRGIWFEDGPFLPIEFARESEDGRITLVLVEGKPSVRLVRSLWTILNSQEVELAKESLAKREGIENIKKYIGFWKKNGDSGGNCVDLVSKWAEAEHYNLDAVIWTNLPPKFQCQENRVPTKEEVVKYLRDIPPVEIEKRRLAEEYIKKAPSQMDTEYRRYIMLELNWLHG